MCVWVGVGGCVWLGVCGILMKNVRMNAGNDSHEEKKEGRVTAGLEVTEGPSHQ